MKERQREIDLKTPFFSIKQLRDDNLLLQHFFKNFLLFIKNCVREDRVWEMVGLRDPLNVKNATNTALNDNAYD